MSTSTLDTIIQTTFAYIATDIITGIGSGIKLEDFRGKCYRPGEIIKIDRPDFKQRFTLKHKCYVEPNKTGGFVIYLIRHSKQKNIQVAGEEPAVVGQGISGPVKIVHCSDTNEYIAKKIKRFYKLDSQPILNELKILKAFGYLKTCFINDKDKTDRHGHEYHTITIIMNKLPGKRLVLVTFKDLYTEFKMALQLLIQVMRIHTLGFIHGDIKADNILYDETSATLKLIDFGSVAKIGKDEYRFYPPLTFMLPELYDQRQSEAKKEHKSFFARASMDIFSLGWVLLINFQNLKTIPSLKELFYQMRCPDHTKRPELDDILKLINNEFNQRFVHIIDTRMPSNRRFSLPPIPLPTPRAPLVPILRHRLRPNSASARIDMNTEEQMATYGPKLP